MWFQFVRISHNDKQHWPEPTSHTTLSSMSNTIWPNYNRLSECECSVVVTPWVPPCGRAKYFVISRSVCHGCLASVPGSVLRSEPAWNSSDPWCPSLTLPLPTVPPVAGQEWRLTGWCLSHWRCVGWYDSDKQLKHQLSLTQTLPQGLVTQQITFWVMCWLREITHTHTHTH